MKVSSGNQGINAYAKSQQAANFSAKQPEKLQAIESKGIQLDKVDLSKGVSARWIQEVLSTEIGNKVNGMLEAEGLDILSAGGLDWSPEGTAKRIFDFTTSMYGLYKEQHPDMTGKEVVVGFEKMVRSSVDKGFQEAMNILAAHNLDEESTNVAKDTMTKLHEMYDEYFSGLRAGLKGDEESAAQADSMVH